MSTQPQDTGILYKFNMNLMHEQFINNIITFDVTNFIIHYWLSYNINITNPIYVMFLGEVVLKDLSFKQSALDDLQLPVKIVYGFLGKF